MSGLLWPGDQRAGALFDDAAVVSAMLTVESAWLSTLVGAGIAPPEAVHELELRGAFDPARTSDGSGNPVVPLVAALRERTHPRNESAARWLHRGLTSQDVLDTALVLCCRAVCDQVALELDGQLDSLATLVDTHLDTPMVARTLTRAAVPTTFGAKASAWLTGVLDAAEDLERVRAALPVQLGGAGANRASLAFLAGSADRVPELVDGLAVRLGLVSAPPWHTARAPLTRTADAWVGLTAAWSRIANDVLILGRAEIGELGEPQLGSRGGSSAMPHKQNPVLSVLVRRAGLAAPALGAQVHLAAAEMVDERADAAWHLEWQALQLLGRHTAQAAAETTELLDGLQVRPQAMAANLAAAGDDIGSELDSLRPFAAPPDGVYAAAAPALCRDVLARARETVQRRAGSR